MLTARGLKLRDVRENMGMTLADVARATGYSVGHLSIVERGLCGAGRKLVAGLASAFGMSIPEVREVVKRTARANKETR